MLVYRNAAGHFTKPRSFAVDFLDMQRNPLEEWPIAVMDDTGRGLIARDYSPSGLATQKGTTVFEQVSVTPTGVTSLTRRSFPGEYGQPTLATSPAGSVVAALGSDRAPLANSVSVMTGTTAGLVTPPQTVDGFGSVGLIGEVMGGQPPATLIVGSGTGAVLAQASKPGAPILHVSP